MQINAYHTHKLVCTFPMRLIDLLPHKTTLLEYQMASCITEIKVYHHLAHSNFFTIF